LFVFQSPIVSLIAVGPVRNCEKSRSGFCAGFFQAAVEIIKKKLPKATFIDFHGCAVSTGLPLPTVLSFCFFFFLVKIRTFDPNIVAPGSRINDDRQPRRPEAWAGFLPRGLLSGRRPLCGSSDPIPPQQHELVQRLSPVLHSVPLPP